MDFGVPLVPRAPADVARYTLLRLADGVTDATAATLVVRLEELFEHADWPDEDVLMARFADYGGRCGARRADGAYTEGILARIVEAATGDEAILPNVATTPGFLCGTEFSSPDGETRFFRDRGLDLAGASASVTLAPGQLLILDNLKTAHARRGRRGTRELHQLILGHPLLPPESQLVLRGAWLRAFGSAGIALR